VKRVWAGAFLAAVVCATLLAAPVANAAAAQAPTLRSLPHACERINYGISLATVCDPEGRAADIRLAVGKYRGHRFGRGLASLDSYEALQPGETLTVRWRHPSRRTVLVVRAFGIEYAPWVTLDMHAQPRWVRVTSRPDGGLDVLTPSGVQQLSPPPPIPTPNWQAKSPQLAAEQLLDAVDHIERSLTATRTVCASLESDVLLEYSLGAGGDPKLRVCVGGLPQQIVGIDYPLAVSTHHHGSTLRVNGDVAILTTRLTHQYERVDSRRFRRTVTVSVLLLRDAEGVWRLATPRPLMPAQALRRHKPYTSANLFKQFRYEASWGRALAKRYTDSLKATVPFAPAAPCMARTVRDDARDVLVNHDAPARDQSARAGLYLREVGSEGDCLVVRTAGALPSSFQLDLNEVLIEVDGGTVRVFDGQHDGPLSGVVAYVNGNEFVIRLPDEVAAPPFQLSISTDPIVTEYDDDVMVDS
jgi:hypothetical protein